jgi:adenosylmethionine-8-amino-7-oxononanoate aminotransferase
MNTLIQQDKAHWIHPVVNWQAHEERGAHIWQSADRVFLKDMQGHEVLDGFSGLWCVNVGYGHESIVQAAAEQMRRLPYATGYFHFASEPTIRLADRLSKLAPEGLERVFFTQGGSDAIDTAVRLTQYYFNITGCPQKKHFIAVQRGYHGSTSVGSGLTALPVFHQNFDAPLPTQHHVSAPYPYRHPAGPDEAAVLSSFIAELRSKIESLGGKSHVAAFVCEPVIGSGGVIFPPQGYLRAVRDICDEFDMLMIADEVITGFGRTGPMFACADEGISPDVMTVAKGLTSGYAPMGAVLLQESIYQTIAKNAPSTSPIGHGQTYSGHPVAAAVAHAVLDLYEGGILANGQAVGRYFEERLKSLQTHRLVGEVRVRGMLGAVELVIDKVTKEKPPVALGFGQKILACAMKNGLVFRAFADDILGFAPPLNFTRDDVDLLIERLTLSIDQASSQCSL